MGTFGKTRNSRLANKDFYMKSIIHFQNERPFKYFFSQLKGKSVPELCLCSPFISSKALGLLSDFLKTRRSTVRLLVNLSPVHLATSISNPVKPLIDLMDKYPSQIYLKSNPDLHAKAFIARTSALFGSSNFTSGGEERNKELNLYISGDSQNSRALLISLQNQFDQYWSSGNEIDLIETDSDWERYYFKVAKTITRFIPNPNLGKDNFGRIKTVMKRRKWKVDDLGKKLSASAKPKAGTYMPKIIFLDQSGFITFHGDHISTNRELWESVKHSPEKVFDVLISKYSFFRDVLECLQDVDYIRYAGLVTSLNLEEKTDLLRAAIRWLESLDYVKRQSKNLGLDRHHKFMITKKGKAYLNRNEPSLIDREG